jgi:hypothetical protein
LNRVRDQGYAYTAKRISGKAHMPFEFIVGETAG